MDQAARESIGAPMDQARVGWSMASALTPLSQHMCIRLSPGSSLSFLGMPAPHSITTRACKEAQAVSFLPVKPSKPYASKLPPFLRQLESLGGLFYVFCVTSGWRHMASGRN